MRDVPQSARLRFREMAEADVAAAHRHWNDPLVRRFLWDDEQVALATVRAVLERSSADFARAGYGMWVLTDGAPGIAGVCGLRGAGGGDDVELVYSIDPARWGRGLATEAGRAVLRHAFERLGVERVLGAVDAPNLASHRVLEKLGMTEIGASGGNGLRYLARTRTGDSSTLA
jgi:ribosomal-protein-alanine N-acetyltransferase